MNYTNPLTSTLAVSIPRSKMEPERLDTEPTCIVTIAYTCIFNVHTWPQRCHRASVEKGVNAEARINETVFPIS